MGMSDRKYRSNLVQIELKGRSQPTIENKTNNTVWIQKSEPIRYTSTELRQIKGKVDNNNEYKILGGHVCYVIRKLRLNRRSARKKKLNRQEVKGGKESTQIKSYRNKN